MDTLHLWTRYREHLCIVELLGFWLDISRVGFPDGFLPGLSGRMTRAFEAMSALEAGAVSNPGEGRMVGHYWLRAPERAPTAALRAEIEGAFERLDRFAADIRTGTVRPERAPRFETVLVIGIGGSALGPQLLADALGTPKDLLEPVFLDNTDPDGMERVFARLGTRLERTLTVVISKSGATKETRNGLIEARAAYAAEGLDLSRHAVAVTGRGSELDRHARDERFLARLPMWDWVGGRTSATSAVGLLPAALQGVPVRELLAGARAMDEATRLPETTKNPAALLAAMWLHLGEGRGAKDMVVIPYCDRLLLLGRYLQQLVMESLGKERDLAGRVVHQGLAVYGNKGSTDQHAYVQQLRDGVDNAFVLFVSVLRERAGAPIEVEPGVTSGDYLAGFLEGTRQALFEKGRDSITLTIPDVGARSIGALLALFERAVGLYAFLIGVNAYDQPGVEAGKRAAGAVVELQGRLLALMRRSPGAHRTAEDLARAVGSPEQAEAVFRLLTRLSANPARGLVRRPATSPFEATFAVRES